MMNNASSSWYPPEEWMKIVSIDAHTAGEPLRVILEGYPDLVGSTILEKRRYALENYDHLRKALILEPRGHADMYGCIPIAPATPDGDIGVLFLHNEGYSSMCGHGIIGLVKVGLETGFIRPKSNPNRVKIDTPAGRVTAEAVIVNGTVEEVSFINVPSFVYASNLETWVTDIGVIHLDIAFGGAFYAFVDAEQFGFQLEVNEYQELINTGKKIKEAVIQSIDIRHPFDEDLSFLYGTIFIGKPKDPSHHSRNVCIFADGEVDRCPTGTGVSARAAIHFSRGEIKVNQSLVIESIIDTCFRVEVTANSSFGPYKAVLPRVTGSAHITSRNEWYIDPDDPLKYGFFIR